MNPEGLKVIIFNKWVFIAFSVDKVNFVLKLDERLHFGHQICHKKCILDKKLYWTSVFYPGLRIKSELWVDISEKKRSQWKWPHLPTNRFKPSSFVLHRWNVQSFHQSLMVWFNPLGSNIPRHWSGNYLSMASTTNQS